ncbi:tyrosine-type recombinase/integrase [Bifidobacterium pseudolongum]|uniref:tyrosine-type recombinase/integrase n=1 Tax=Bifidobacterium pseudolongum TaxID=1694 RepID=UPI00101FA8B4|nr:site-specific integrase [Bifidobacterium pseudolongum]RYQ67051.1 Phage integrase family [Bifidobacterium pseudolongum subsp. globosum]
MGRRFGSIKLRPNKHTPRYLSASYPTPIEARELDPTLPERQSRNFPLTAEVEARAWLEAARKKIDAGAWQPDRDVKRRERASALTFGEYFPEWLAARTRSDGTPLRASSRSRLERDAANHVLPYFAHIRLADITQSMVDRWLATLPSGQPYVRAHAYKVVRAVLRTASKPGDDGEPPLIPVYPLTRGVATPKRETATVPATPQEVHAIYKAMPPEYRMSVYLAVFCDGLRIGEVCALQRGDIDFEHRILHIRRGRLTEDPDSKVGPPKTANSVRDIKIPPQLIQPLRDFLDDHVDDTDDAWLFHGVRDHTQPVHPNTIRIHFDQARRKAGRPDLRFHDLRHSALTWLAAEGATLKELMESAGHSDVSAAIRYQHAVDARRETLAEKMGEKLLADDTPETVMARIRDIDRRIAELESLKANEKLLLQKLMQDV